MLAKNGTDATTIAVTIARAATEKRKVLIARKAYHGAAPWCTPYPAGVTPEDRAHQIFYDYNDPASLVEAAEAAGDDLAAIIATAIRHDIGRDHEMPTPDFAEAARKVADAGRRGPVLDDVRSGFRLDLGGSWELVGVRPDLTAFSKAIANGYRWRPSPAGTASATPRPASSPRAPSGSRPSPWQRRSPRSRSSMRRDGMLACARRRAAARRTPGPGDSRGIKIRQSGPPQMPWSCSRTIPR